ncbi:hypothetical protein Ancab_025097 [Ancistrocladus abbreviatus]
MQRSLQLCSIFVVPCFIADATYKIWWYSSGASQIPFVGNTIILRLQDFAKVFQDDSDVASMLAEHLRIRRHLRIISHRFRVFILWSLILITMSQFTSLLMTTKSHADINIFNAGELALCSITLMTGFMVILRSATKITHKAQAITCLAAKWHVCATIDFFGLADADIMTNQNSRAAFPEAVNLESDGEDPGDEEDDVDNTKLIPAHAFSTISFQKRQALGKFITSQNFSSKHTK